MDEDERSTFGKVVDWYRGLSRNGRIWLWVGLVLVVGYVGSLISPSTTRTASSDGPAAGETAQADFCVADGNEMGVNESCFDQQWPLTVSEGTLACTGAGAVTFKSPTGKLYAVNGMASSQDLGDDIDPIWEDNPDYAGFKIDIGPLITRGLSLCS